jgi:hypothetical protein
MSEEKREAYIEKRKVCPFRLIAFGIHHGDANVQYCIREQCAWYLICYNLSNLAEILARSREEDII